MGFWSILLLLWLAPGTFVFALCLVAMARGRSQPVHGMGSIKWAAAQSPGR
jgi:hypothetical protein